MHYFLSNVTLTRVRGGLRVYFGATYGELQFFTAFFQVSTVRARLEEVESEALAAKEETATLREVMLGSKVL